MTRAIRHATIRSLAASKSRRMTRLAHRAAWLIEARGVNEHYVSRHMKRFGTANDIRPAVLTYKMHQRFVMAELLKPMEGGE